MAIFFVQKELILFAFGAMIVLILLLWLIRLEGKIRGLYLGEEGSEETLGALSVKTEEARKRVEKLEILSERMEKRISKSVQGVETVRFNPFREAGSGNQSFASAFLSENGDGVVISSLYSRDRVGIFGKPVSQFTSSFELTEEEAEALKRAAEKIKSS